MLALVALIFSLMPICTDHNYYNAFRAHVPLRKDSDRAILNVSDASNAAPCSAIYITNMREFDLRQGQPGRDRAAQGAR